MSDSIFEVSGLRLPYHFFSSPALGADIQDVKTPEEGYALIRAFQKANKLFSYLIKIWTDFSHNNEITTQNASGVEIHIDFADYPANTVYLNIKDDYLWLNLPYVFDDNKVRSDYYKTASWRLPVTPHAFYCLLRLNIAHIPKRETKEYHENSEYAQHIALVPKLDAFAEKLIGNEDNDEDDAASETCE